MKHFMKLNPEPFEMIKTGKKSVEMRLYDEKRRLISGGDEIEFANNASGEKLIARVGNVRFFNDFAQLYAVYLPVSLGYGENEDASPDDMCKFYSRKDIAKYGVVAIELISL